MTRRLELWVQILELNDAGEFVPVEVQPAKDVCTGGIFQLKQVCVGINDSNEVENTFFPDLIVCLCDRVSPGVFRWRCVRSRTPAPCL